MAERFVQVTDTTAPAPRAKFYVPENHLKIFPNLRITQEQQKVNDAKNGPAGEDENPDNTRSKSRTRTKESEAK